MLLLGAENGIFFRPILRQMPGLNVTKEWENHLFWGVGTVFPYWHFFFISGPPIELFVRVENFPRMLFYCGPWRKLLKSHYFLIVASLLWNKKSFICCLHFFWLWKQKAPNLFLLNSEFIRYSKLLVGRHIGCFTDHYFSSSTAVKGPSIRALSYAQQSFWRWRGGEVWKVILSMAFTEYVSLLGGHLGFSEGLINQN